MPRAPQLLQLVARYIEVLQGGQLRERFNAGQPVVAEVNGGQPVKWLPVTGAAQINDALGCAADGEGVGGSGSTCCCQDALSYSSTRMQGLVFQNQLSLLPVS
jgi:hypothetical protein